MIENTELDKKTNNDIIMDDFVGSATASSSKDGMPKLVNTGIFSTTSNLDNIDHVEINMDIEGVEENKKLLEQHHYMGSHAALDRNSDSTYIIFPKENSVVSYKI